MEKEPADNNIYRKEFEILENSEDVIRKIEDVVHNENISKEFLLNEYIHLSGEYNKLLKTSKKITSIGDMNQKKLFTAYEKIQQQRLEIEMNNSELYRISITDPLTKQYTRGYLFDALSKEFSRAKRSGLSLSCLFFDIDFFKNVNDTYGHQIGDYILEYASSCIKENLRNGDILGRYGGEEFIAILPNTRIEDAKTAAEKIRNAIFKKEFFMAGTKIQITLSCGISDMEGGQPKDEDELIRNADLALYEAKRRGRNNTVLYNIDLKSQA